MRITHILWVVLFFCTFPMSIQCPFNDHSGSITEIKFKSKINSESEVISMAKNGKQTSSRVASTASRILRDGRYGKDSKSVAASALAQAKPRGKK